MNAARFCCMALLLTFVAISACRADDDEKDVTAPYKNFSDWVKFDFNSNVLRIKAKPECGERIRVEIEWTYRNGNPGSKVYERDGDIIHDLVNEHKGTIRVRVQGVRQEVKVKITVK